MKYTQHYRINANEADYNNIVSASGVLRYMQDAAYSQMEVDTPSYNDLFERGLSFVLSRIRMSIYKPLRSHDEIDAETWAAGSHGASFNRCYRVLRDGGIVAEAVSVWAILDLNKKRLRHADTIDFSYGEDEMLELDMEPRFRIPKDIPMSLVGERSVDYGDCDMNRHLNNTHYPDILCGFLPDMDGKRVITMEISFVGEAHLGETLKVYCGSFDGSYYVRTVRGSDGKTNVEAEFTLEEIR